MIEQQVATDSHSVTSDASWGDTGPGWLYALNRFLERVYLQADVETGC
jgi:hypothetical protein